MTDEQMDARLRGAGDRWRLAGQTVTAEPAAAVLADPSVITRRRRGGLLVSAAAVAAALVAGATLALHGLGNDRTYTVATTSLEGTVWQLVGYGDERIPSSYATFYIGTDGELVADDECMIIAAKANLADGHIYPTDISLRERSCTDSTPPTFATTGLDVLTSGASYTIAGDRLTISGDSTEMHLVALPGAAPPSLDVPTFEGADWQLERVTNAAGVTSAGRGTLVIRDAMLSAAVGPDHLTAAVAVDGSRVDVKNFAGATEIPSLSSYVSVVTAVLGGGRFDQVVDGTTLTLKSPDGTLRYRWVPKDGQAVDPAALNVATWYLTRVANGPTIGDATLRFTGDGTYTANDGCASFSGRVRAGRGVFVFTGVPKNPSCGGAKGNEASTVDSFLDTTSLWSIRDGKLIIDGGGAQAFSLVYISDLGQPGHITGLTDTSLTGTWTLTSIEHDTAHSGSGEGGSDLGIVLAFTGRRYRAEYHCGSSDSGTFVKAQHTLDITVRGSAQGSCPAPAPAAAASRHDQLVSALFRGRVTWHIGGNELTLVKGGTTLAFEKR